MAVSERKLHIKDNNGSWDCSLYSTKTESGTAYVNAKTDNIDYYIPLTDNTSRATPLRVTRNGVTYRLAWMAKPAYGKTGFSSSGTFTVPSGITRVRYTIVAAGGGGAHSWGGWTKAGTGGDSSFGGVTCTGGTGGYVGAGQVGEGGSPGGSNGNWGGDNASLSNVDPYTVTDINGNTIASNLAYGGGAGGPANTTSEWDECATGGSGGRTNGYLSVTPNASMAVVVGTGGSGSNINQEAWSFANKGGNGYVLIEYGGDIETEGAS